LNPDPLIGVEGKNVIITGAANGMGKSHAHFLAAHGANVVLTDIAADAGAAVARDIGSKARFVRHDVASAADWTNVVAVTEKEFGPVAALINNAGIGYVVSFDDLTEAEYRKFIDINQVGVFLGMKAVVPSMRRRGGGSIINISSASGLRGGENILAYVGTKFAVTGMSKSAAIDLGPDGIRVNSVHPGLIGGTGLLEQAGDYIKPILQRTPLRRFADVKEVSALILFLVSDGSGFVNGAEIAIDGGLIARQ